MGRVVIPGVMTTGGRLYFRRRWRDNKGKRRVQLIALPPAESPEFAAALAKAKGEAKAVRKPAGQGTVAALCHLMRTRLPSMKNSKGKPLSAVTVTNYRRYIDRIDRELGENMVADLMGADAYDIQERLIDTPGVANNYLSVFRMMLQHAVKMGCIPANPFVNIKPLSLSEHEPWPERVIEAALSVATPMTRLALVTYLCSGQRGGDIIRMRHNWHDGRIMQLQHGKTVKPVAIPMHALWLAEIGKVPARAVTILYDRSGRPFQSLATLRERINDLLARETVAAAIAQAIDEGEMPADADLHPHGLRKNAACYLLEAGATEEQIGAILGMSPDIVRLYTRRVRVRKIAEAVGENIAGATVTPLRGNSNFAG